MTGRRLLRVRVLDALQARVKQFRTREDLWPLRVPREPVPMDDVIRGALPDDYHDFDPLTLRSRTLLHLAWGRPDRDRRGGRSGHEAEWEAWVIALPSGVKLYCDSGEDETRILASGGRNEGDESDRLFLRLLSESAGQHFGIEMSGGAPAHVRSSIADHEFLVDLFVNLFEVTGTEDSVRNAVKDPAAPASPGRADFRSDVEQWMKGVVRLA
jgi:hypothetical protein